jgi:hypothetical protein
MMSARKSARMMQPPVQMRAISERFRLQLYVELAAARSDIPCA